MSPCKERKSYIWSLVNELDKAFDLPDPKMHDFFKNAKEMNESGFVKTFESYECLNNIKIFTKQKHHPNLVGEKKIFLILK